MNQRKPIFFSFKFYEIQGKAVWPVATETLIIWTPSTERHLAGFRKEICRELRPRKDFPQLTQGVSLKGEFFNQVKSRDFFDFEMEWLEDSKNNHKGIWYTTRRTPFASQEVGGERVPLHVWLCDVAKFVSQKMALNCIFLHTCLYRRRHFVNTTYITTCCCPRLLCFP